MEVRAKPGADLLWAFQLHREHRTLSSRLNAVEASAAQQQERITAGEPNAHSDQHERVDALTERLRKLEDADVSEQVAGLAAELRVTRQQLEQARDKLKAIEKANKEADDKAQDKNRDVQARLEKFAGVVTQTQNAVHALEGRMRLAVDAVGRIATDGLAVLSERYEKQLGALSEQLRSLDRVQGDLRALLQSGRRDHLVAETVSASRSSEAPHITEQDATLSTLSHSHGGKEYAHNEPQAISELSAQVTIATDMPAPQRSSNMMPPITKTPGTAVQKSTVSSMGKRKRGFEKEIDQLIHGDGSLTNAPIILESQEPGATTRGSKKLKTEPVKGISLRSGFTQQVVSTSNIKKEPAVTRAKALAHPAVSVVSGKKTAAKTAAKRSAPEPATTATQEQKGKTMSKKAPVPKKRLLPMSAPARPLMPEEKTTKQQEQRPKQRRRRIEQDDSMEEFLAKCEAAAEK